MYKILLEIQSGDWTKGWDVELKLFDAQSRLSANIPGKLPPTDGDLCEKYEQWQSIYRDRVSYIRLHANSPRGITMIEDSSELTNFSVQDSGDNLIDDFNNWLNQVNGEFQPIRDRLGALIKLSEQVDSSILFIVKTGDARLRQLPWHVWDLLAECDRLEVALSPVEFETPKIRYQKSSQRVEILAILGDDTGIDYEEDSQYLQKLENSGAHTVFLVKKDRRKINDSLWDQPWDILYFAGHSNSREEEGRIYINQNDSLTIAELREGLRKAIAKGLKIAIFNSCDGLKLAEALADLQIPQIIVMREPVQDKIAQEFLKYFLKAFTGGEIFHLAVREARKQLQGWEDDFPCASWLPTIYQNPTEKLPTWKDLRREKRPKLNIVLLISMALTMLVMGVRYWGLLQPLELAAYDHFMRSRPGEIPERDPRFLIVTIDKEDVEYQANQGMKFAHTSSLSDEALEQLLLILQKQLRPVTIGLDIYHEHPLSPSLEPIVNNKDSNLFFICKMMDKSIQHKGVAPPENIANNDAILHYGFNDVLPNKDDIIRLHLLSIEPESGTRDRDKCDNTISFSFLIALHYLHTTQGINIKYRTKSQWQLGSRLWGILPQHISRYQGVDKSGYKIFLNYRSNKSPDHIAEQITLKEVLENGISNSTVSRLTESPIVLIGNIDRSNKDVFKTPYGKKIPGIFLQAQMVSQIISAVLDDRPLIWWWPLWIEFFWILFWSILGGLLLRWIREPRKLLLSAILSLGGLWGISFLIFIQAGWVPLIPPALALIGTIVVLKLSVR